MAVLNNSNAISTTGGYDINNSLRFRSSASAYLSRTPASAGNRKTWTWSCWVKRGNLGALQAILDADNATGGGDEIRFNADNTFTYFINGAVTGTLTTTQVFRDPSAWYHIVLAVDTTQATAANRAKLYINGSQVTAFSTATYPTQNADTDTNTATSHRIGFTRSSQTFDGYMAESHFIDGSAKAASDFGETDTTTGVWKPKAYTGTYGTNGFYQKYSSIALTSGSNTGLGQDFSGNGNYFNTNNVSVTAGTTYDAMLDVPTNTSATVANYPTLNPISSLSGGVTISEANLRFASAGASTSSNAYSTIGMTTGKWYCEVTVLGTDVMVGLANAFNLSLSSYIGSASSSWGYYRTGNKYNAGSFTAYGATYTTNDVIGIAFDADAGTLTFYKNNTSQGTAFSSLTSGPYFFAVGNNSVNHIGAINFGQRPFSYTPPTGYLALNTFNLPNSTIVKGSTVMDATTYTGNGTSQSVTNAGAFKPDFVWVKGRNNTYNNILEDSVRGATKYLLSDSTAAETTDATTLTSFNSNGFSLGSNIALNQSTFNFVGWQWQAGQGSTSSNTSGTVTSTVSVNATAGFSVVTWAAQSTARTVGHGLGVAPSMIIMKDRSGAIQWFVYHASIGAGKYLTLNTTATSVTNATVFSTAPTSSVFDPGTGFTTGNGYGNQVAYCWAEIAGFSKFGSYTGNNSNDGPFVYCGFRPKFVMIKDTNTAGYWAIFDTVRSTYNVTSNYLQAQSSAAEVSLVANIDFLSNGFKLRANNANSAQNNVSGNTYIYMAFAENPFKNSLAR
jgi:hypothetical protein